MVVSLLYHVQNLRLLGDKYNILYVKTPKTGSSSVKDTLIDYCVFNDIKYSTNSVEGIDRIKTGIGASLGHITYDLLIKKVKPKLIYSNKTLIISSVREPLDKYISHCGYIGRNVNHYQGFKNKGWDKIMDNQMCYYLGFSNLESITKENIKNKFDYVTVLDEWDKSMSNLSDLMGTQLKNYHTIPYSFYSNRNPKRKNNQINPSVVNLYKKNNEMDYKLYELCKEIYV